MAAIECPHGFGVRLLADFSASKAHLAGLKPCLLRDHIGGRECDQRCVFRWCTDVLSRPSFSIRSRLCDGHSQPLYLDEKIKRDTGCDRDLFSDRVEFQFVAIVAADLLSVANIKALNFMYTQ